MSFNVFEPFMFKRADYDHYLMNSARNQANNQYFNHENQTAHQSARAQQEVPDHNLDQDFFRNLYQNIQRNNMEITKKNQTIQSASMAPPRPSVPS